MRPGDPISRPAGRPVEPLWDDGAVSRDGPKGPGTSGEEAGTSGNPALALPKWLSGPWVPYGSVALFTAAICAVNAFTAAHDRVRQGAAYDLGTSALWEGTSGLVIVALLPLVALAAKRLRTSRGWAAAAALFGAAAVTLSLLHVAGMVALRKLALAALGRSYAFDWISDLGYEMRKDVVTFALIMTVFWLLDRATVPAPQAAPVPAPPDAPSTDVWLKDGATRIRIDAGDIVWVSSAGNYVEFKLSGRSHLVRGTLGSEEERLLPFGIVRVHRTRLVNLKRVTAVEPRPSGDAALILDTGETVTASRRYKQALDIIAPKP